MMKVLLAVVLTVSALSSGSVVKAPGSGDTFELLILHNNDMHARFEQTSQGGGRCSIEDRDAGKCYGGFPRVAHVVKEARQAAADGTGPPVLYLNAGDTYTGTPWFTLYKWKIAAEFINALQPDAVSLGNGEIEAGSQKFTPFIENLETYILASNVIIKSAKQKTNIRKSIIFDVKGVKVGVVGYLTPESNILDSLGDVEYIDEVLAVSEEVTELQSQKVNIIIALGHSTLAKEQEIAKDVAGIDMIIAGSQNVFYWNGTTVSEQHQPIVVTQNSGKEVPIFPSTAYNKYLGSLRATFDENGELVTFSNEPILLDSAIPQDREALKKVNNHYAELVSSNSEVIGKTSVVLDGKSCSLEECNFGNLITDAMMYYYATRFQGENWTDAPIAIIHSGAIAGSIAPSNRPADITRGELLASLPLESNLVVVVMNGAVLTQVLEHSVRDYDPNNPSGGFLQFSGVRAVYDMEKEPGFRLVEAVARCWSCHVPEFYQIDDWRDYKVLMPASLANGAFGYNMLTRQSRVALTYDEVRCTEDFIQLRSPVYPEVAGRIVLRNIPASAIALSSSLLFIVLISFSMQYLN